MQKLFFAIAATSLSLLVGWAVASPPTLSTATHISALRGTRGAPSGRYLNVDAGYGSAELTFLDNGRYTYGDDGSVSAEGTYRIAGDQITIVEDGPADAACLYRPGKYGWQLSGKTLMLKEIADTCPARQYDWHSGEWLEERD